jgi:hypothetical protein
MTARFLSPFSPASTWTLRPGRASVNCSREQLQQIPDNGIGKMRP